MVAFADNAKREWAAAELERLMPLVCALARRSKIPLPIEDVRQEAFAAAWQALLRYDSTRGASPKTWVTAKVTGNLLDVHRQIGGRGGARSRTKFYSLDAIMADASGADEDSRSRLLHDHRPGLRIRERRARWRQILKGFLPRERSVLLRRFCLRQTAAKIARCLGVSVGYVDQIASNALAKLRKLEASEHRVTEACA